MASTVTQQHSQAPAGRESLVSLKPFPNSIQKVHHFPVFPYMGGLQEGIWKHLPCPLLGAVLLRLYPVETPSRSQLVTPAL